METINDVLQEVYLLKEAFPTLVKLLKIVLTIAVSTAQCEQSFSALKCIKTFLRSTMSEQHLTDLALLSIEKQLSQTLPLDDVIDRFAAADTIRRIVLLSHTCMHTSYDTCILVMHILNLLHITKSIDFIGHIM